jgi:hypothetical protein
MTGFLTRKAFKNWPQKKRSRGIARVRPGQTAKRIRLDAQRNCDLVCRAILLVRRIGRLGGLLRGCSTAMWHLSLDGAADHRALGPVGKIRCMIVLSAIFYFSDGNRFVRGAGRVVRASGVALLDTSREPRDGGAGFYRQSLRDNEGGA